MPQNYSPEFKKKLKKAAAFFAKEIDQRIIGLSINIIRDSVYAGCCGGWACIQTLIITTGKPEGGILRQKGGCSGTN